MKKYVYFCGSDINLQVVSLNMSEMHFEFIRRILKTNLFDGVFNHIFH